MLSGILVIISYNNSWSVLSTSMNSLWYVSMWFWLLCYSGPYVFLPVFQIIHIQMIKLSIRLNLLKIHTIILLLSIHWLTFCTFYNLIWFGWNFARPTILNSGFWCRMCQKFLFLLCIFHNFTLPYGVQDKWRFKKNGCPDL